MFMYLLLVLTISKCSQKLRKSEHRPASRYCASVERRTVSSKLELWGRLCSIEGELGEIQC